MEGEKKDEDESDAKTHLSHGQIHEMHDPTTNFDPHGEKNHLGELPVGLEKSVEPSVEARRGISVDFEREKQEEGNSNKRERTETWLW